MWCFKYFLSLQYKSMSWCLSCPGSAEQRAWSMFDACLPACGTITAAMIKSYDNDLPVGVSHRSPTSGFSSRRSKSGSAWVNTLYENATKNTLCTCGINCNSSYRLTRVCLYKHFFMFLLSVEGSGGAEVLQVWILAAGGALYYYTHQGSPDIAVIYMFYWIL